MLLALETGKRITLKDLTNINSAMNTGKIRTDLDEPWHDVTKDEMRAFVGIMMVCAKAF